MKKRLYQCRKGFILFETLLAFTVITFSILFFYRGSLESLLDSEQKQQELQSYRVLYEEISEARKNGKQKGTYPVIRSGSFQIDYQLEGIFYAEISESNQNIRISRQE